MVCVSGVAESMNLSRYSIVFALLAAAAVLYPMRRAQAALAHATAVRGTGPVVRGPMRRRFSHLRTAKRSQPASDRQDPGGARASRQIAAASNAHESASTIHR